MKDLIRQILREETSGLTDGQIKASYSLMNMITKGYHWYREPFLRSFKRTPSSIWLINPDTKEWVFHLYYGGEMWCNSDLFFKFQRDVKRYFNMEGPYFEWFLRLWVEDVVNRKVHKLRIISGDGTNEVEDALKNGIQIK